MDDDEALDAIREAARAGRYAIHPHCIRRMVQRGFDRFDVKAALMSATRAEPFADPVRALVPVAVSCWRVFGLDQEGEALTLGVELARDHLGHYVLVVTAF